MGTGVHATRLELTFRGGERAGLKRKGVVRTGIRSSCSSCAFQCAVEASIKRMDGDAPVELYEFVARLLMLNCVALVAFEDCDGLD